MALELDIQSLMDIGLLLLLGFGAMQLFVARTSNADGAEASWSHELYSLEESLRELIGEAGAASRNLDRNLLQRKRELEGLLKEFDAKEKSVEAVEPNVSKIPVEDLPNETWGQAAPEPKTREAETPAPKAASLSGGYGAGGIPKKPAASKKVTPEQALGSLVAGAQDTATLSKQLTKEVLRQQAELRGADDKEHAASQALADQMAEANERADLDDNERVTFDSTSIMDPMTYKIARRLIAAGKEIHVVARKLDLPVSEIRLLDRLIRREEGRSVEEFSSEESSVEESRAESTPAPARTSPLENRIEASSLSAEESLGEGSFSAPAGRFESSSFFGSATEPSVAVAEERDEQPVTPVVSDLDQDIERELALL